MIWLLLLKPRFHKAVVESLVGLLFGDRCRVTGERIHACARAGHEHDDHPGEGTCA